MKTFKQINLIILSILALTFISCNDDDTATVEQGTSNLTVRLTDAPGDYDNVFIDVVDVMVKVNNDSDDDSSWQSAGPINPGIYDLLELTGGLNVLLVDGFQVPSGILNQIRLVLGENNTIVIDGETFPLRTPSAQQSGLKIKINEQLLPGFTYDVLLDFQVDESIVIAGNSGNINLKPVIQASTQYTSGAIEGTVTPFDFQVLASVEINGDVFSAYTDNTGAFMINGLPAGSYSVTLTPDLLSGYNTVIVEDVLVSAGTTVNMGTIILD